MSDEVNCSSTGGGGGGSSPNTSSGGAKDVSGLPSPTTLGQMKERASNNEPPTPVVRRQAAGSQTAVSTSNKPVQSKPNIRRCARAKLAPKGQRQRAKRQAGPRLATLDKLPQLSLHSQPLTPQPPGPALAQPSRGLGNTMSGQLAMRTAPGSTHICSGCKRPIKDRYLLSACDKFWHDDCLKCDRCHAKLGELGSTLYERANMNLCRQDYLEMFGQKAICAVCDKLIYASEMVMRARDNVYHLECFACQLCGLRFCIGDRFHLCENKIVCQYDYDEHIYPIQESMFDYRNVPTMPAGLPAPEPHGHLLGPGSATQSLGYGPAPTKEPQTSQNESSETPIYAGGCHTIGSEPAANALQGQHKDETRQQDQQQQQQRLDSHRELAESIELTVFGCDQSVELAARPEAKNGAPSAESASREHNEGDERANEAAPTEPAQQGDD